MKLIRAAFLSLILLLTACDSILLPQNQTYVCLTFDDQHRSIYNIAYPLLEEFGMKGTMFINTAVINNRNKLTWAEIETMVNESGWETGGHTLHHVELPELTYQEAYDEIYLDYLNLVNRGLPHNSFALPSGHASEANFQIIAEFYNNIRTSMNLMHYAPLNRLYLGYLPFQTGDNQNVMISRIIQALENNEDLVILGFHSFDPVEGDDITVCDPQIFREILEFINENELPVLTINEACEILGSN